MFYSWNLGLGILENGERTSVPIYSGHCEDAGDRYRRRVAVSSGIVQVVWSSFLVKLTLSMFTDLQGSAATVGGTS